MVRISLHSIHSSSETLSISLHILPHLTTWLPSFQHSELSWPILKTLNLADPDFLTPSPIDIILGADYYSQIIRTRVIRHNFGNLIAQDTFFRWVILGPIPTSHHVSLSVQQSYTNEDIQHLLTKFWQLEEAPAPQSESVTLSPDELQCEQFFLQTHFRNRDGRYVVRLPFSHSPSLLGHSYNSAIRILKQLLIKLNSDSNYHDLYHRFMREYKSLQHLTVVSSPDSDFSPNFFLPHHGILKEDDDSWKIRVVFNGSFKTIDGPSLNDLLHIGAKLQSDIFEVLLFFRRFRFVFITDITKMFRQIIIHPEDRRFQRILWVDDNNEIKIHELNTVTYGTRSAPFLAGRVMNQLIIDEGHRFPLAVEPMTKGRYVDDISGGADSAEELLSVAQQLIEVCRAGGFPLAKWKTNTPILSKDFFSSQSSELEHSFDHVLYLDWS